MPMDWDKLRVFHAVALAGSFTRATDILNISQSAISRQVSILEEELGVALFNRVARGLELTEAGQKLSGVVTSVFGKVAMTEAAILEAKTVPCGHLEVSASLSFGTMWLAPRIQKFLDQYPEIHVDLLLKNEGVDLNMREADIGLTTSNITNPEMIQSRPVVYRHRVFAGKKYLAKYGTPKTAADLDQHRLIVFRNNASGKPVNEDYLLNKETDEPREPYLVVGSALGLANAIRGNVGIGVSHRYIMGNDPNVVELEFECPKVYRKVVYPKELEHLKRVQVFAEFLLGEMEASEL